MGRYRWGQSRGSRVNLRARELASRQFPEFECDVQHFHPHVDQLCGIGPFLMACREQLAQNFRVDRTIGAV